MKKIISRKLYDTATAELIAEWSNGRSLRDFSWCQEELYRKKTGEFFLHGEGGPMSQYVHYIDDNNWSGDEQLIPLTYDEAAEWAEKHMDADAYQAVFGEIAEDDTSIMFTCRLPASSVDKLRRASGRSGRTQQDILTDLINTL